MNKLITIDPEIMAGTPVFVGTRVPIQMLIVHHCQPLIFVTIQLSS